MAVERGSTAGRDCRVERVERREERECVESDSRGERRDAGRSEKGRSCSVGVERH